MKIYKSITFVIILILTVLIVKQVKNAQWKKTIIKKMISQTGIAYDMSANKVRRDASSRRMEFNSENSLNCYKLVYEVNFDCSVCLEKLKRVNSFYLKLNDIYEISFILITTEKSSGFVDYNINQSLDDYDLWVVEQKFRTDDYRLYLLDGLNKIVMAGDITEYPFLQHEYARKLEVGAARRPRR